MALIKSTFLAQISGSLNGATFSHNAGGAYIRNRSLPSNPETDRQDQVRTAMASLSKAWGSVLTEEQRQLWRNFGSNTHVQNRIGDQITLSGIAAYNRVNLFRMSTLNLAPVDEPPDPTGSPDPAPTFVNALSGGNTVGQPLNVDIAFNAASTGYSVAVYYSGPLSPGIRYYRGPYVGRTTQAVTGASVTVTTPGVDLIADGSPNIALKITLYDTTTSLPIWTVHTDPVTPVV